MGDSAAADRPDGEAIAEAARVAFGCVSHARLLTTQARSGTVRVLATSQPAVLSAPGALRGGALAVRLTAASEPARPAVTGYSYRLIERNGRELVAFHWHPDSNVPAPPFPHLHLSAALVVPKPSGDSDEILLDKLHMPTGFVSLPAVVRMLIEEFGVRPLMPRWQQRLADAEQALQQAAPNR